jgi:hypothetical protein
MLACRFRRVRFSSSRCVACNTAVAKYSGRPGFRLRGYSGRTSGARGSWNKTKMFTSNRPPASSGDSGEGAGREDRDATPWAHMEQVALVRNNDGSLTGQRKLENSVVLVISTVRDGLSRFYNAAARNRLHLQGIRVPVQCW